MIQLLYFSCWVQTARYQKSGVLQIKVGKSTNFNKYFLGAPALIKNYYPGTKIYIFDTVNRTQLPMIEIIFNQYQSKSFLLSNYYGHESEPHVQIIRSLQDSKADDLRILFTFQLLKNTQKLYEKYCHEKSDIEKHYLCQGIRDFIRSEQEFLAQFQRNQEIEQIRQLEAQESRIERDLCEEIMNTKKYSISTGKLIIVIVIFLFVGFLVGRHDQNKKGTFITNLFYPSKSGDKDQEILDQGYKRQSAKSIKTKKSNKPSRKK